MSNIRVTYSGLLSFIVGISSIFTGLAFVLIVTRRLSPEEFGTWALIGNMVFYFLISERIISFWTTRQIAREENVGKTAIFSSSLFSLGSIPIYILAVFLIASQTETNLNILILGAILIPVQFLSQTLASINLGHKPHVKSYGLLFFEAVKIPLGLGFVYFLDLGTAGAIYTLIIAYIVRLLVQGFFARNKIKGSMHFSIFKRWIKFSWISLYSHLTNSIWKIDVLIYAIITGSVIGIAYYSASIAVAGTLKHTSLVSQALYPKLLAKGNYHHIQDNFSLLMYFAIPILGIVILFSKPGLFALNPAYQNLSLVVILLAFQIFFNVLRNVLDKVLFGIEKIDYESDPKFSSLLKSKLFFVPTRKIIHFGIYISTFIVSLLILKSQNASEVELVEWWALIALIFEIPFFIYLYYVVKKSVSISFPIKRVVKYIGATMTFIFVYYQTSDHFIKYHESIFDFLPGVLAQLVISVGIYFLITYLIDKKTRLLVKTVLNELI